MSTVRADHDCLKSGGTYVFEMGAHGNVAEVQTALIHALVQQDISVEKARDKPLVLTIRCMDEERIGSGGISGGEGGN